MPSPSHLLFRLANIRIAILLAASTAVQAGPPLTTEDAGTLSPGACQLEFEHRRFRDVKELDVLPACNLFLDTEVQLGYLGQRPRDAERINRTLLQVKKNLIEDEKGWNIGLAVGAIRERGAGTAESYATLPFTRTWDATTLNLNLGIKRDHLEQRSRGTWATAVEHEATDRITLVGEIFGAKDEKETAQIGLRYWLIPKRVQLTTSIGAQRDAGRDGRWTSFGIRFETE